MIDFDEGQLILLNKPYGQTSFQAVKFVKYTGKIKKVGHAGTLDPLASGLLILCTGKWTKKITELQLQEKEYTGTFTLGATTPSYDMETAVDKVFDLSNTSEEEIRNTAKQFTGILQQTPPVYSAIKIDGKRAYKHARKGEDVLLKSREIEVKEFEITSIRMPEVDFRIVCSKGTYIRSIANDFGQALNTGAYLSALCRTRIGNHHLSAAMDYDGFKNWIASAGDIRVEQVE